ncbi:hypothetical protein A9K55_004265 [Cordyceps militaris]|uniref:Uncharacterized protein n=1 Tax=Cordyceps militaris TaxID=73501 RepID=A0A2H4SM84_CORMI|nr:hypothetical protein A9K55_004265 [Cordyceps militaris]
MAPSRRTTRATSKKAAASRKGTNRLPLSSSEQKQRIAAVEAVRAASRKAASRMPPSSSLAEQVRALERAHADLVAESAQQQQRIAELEAALAEGKRKHGAERLRLIQRGGLFLGKTQRALEQKVALEAQLAAAETRLASRAAWEEQVARDRLESKILWTAAQVAIQRLCGPEQQRGLERILTCCQKAFTGPACLPASVSSVMAEDPFVVQVPSTPPHVQQMPLTPVSVAPESVEAEGGSSSPVRGSYTPRREGLRPKRKAVDANGSPGYTRI